MSNPPQKVSLYNTVDLKNATDDFLSPYLTSLPKPYKFTQSHTKTDVRLALASTAVTIAGILFYADWKLGWDATKPYTAPACIAYFVINGLFTYWIWAVEANTVFEGTREGGQKLVLKSFTKKHTPIYRLKVQYTAPSGKEWINNEISGSFTTWFNTHGYLDKKALKTWLASNIEVIGLADPLSLQSGEMAYLGVVDDVVSSSSMSTSTSSGAVVNNTTSKTTTTSSNSMTTGVKSQQQGTGVTKTATSSTPKTGKSRKA